MTYRTGNHWGVTIVSETDTTGICADRSCPDRGDHPSHDQAQLVAVVVNGDQALAERICNLLNADQQPKGALAYDTTKAIHKHLRILGYTPYGVEWDGALAAARAYVELQEQATLGAFDSCTCPLPLAADPYCPVHHGRRARGPKPAPVGPGCICDGSGRTCPRHGAVI